MSAEKVVVSVKVSGCWFSTICESPAEAYKAASAIFDSPLYRFDDTDKQKSEIMRSVLNIFDGHIIGHQGHLLSIGRYEEDEADG